MSVQQKNMLLGTVLLAMGAIAISLVHRRHTGISEANTDLRAGEHIVFVFLAPSNMATNEFSTVLQAAEDSVGAYAVKLGASFSTVGVSDSWDVQNGIELLASFGHFDEIIVGRNFMNTGLVIYLWRDLPGPLVLPQILVVHQTLTVEGDKATYGYPVELRRAAGPDEFRRWQREGFRVPNPTTPT